MEYLHARIMWKNGELRDIKMLVVSACNTFGGAHKLWAYSIIATFNPCSGVSVYASTRFPKFPVLRILFWLRALSLTPHSQQCTANAFAARCFAMHSVLCCFAMQKIPSFGLIWHGDTFIMKNHWSVTCFVKTFLFSWFRCYFDSSI